MTAQFHEKLILEGKETSIAFCPPIPTDHPRIKMYSNEEMNQRIKKGKMNALVFSSACWRGYFGTWELKDGKLYLMSVDGRFDIIGDEPIFADWVTAVLRIPDGEMLHYVHMGFGSVYEFETHIKLENGMVVDERRIDNRNKDFRGRNLGSENLPGDENNFDGDDL